MTAPCVPLIPVSAKSTWLAQLRPVRGILMGSAAPILLRGEQAQPLWLSQLRRKRQGKVSAAVSCQSNYPAALSGGFKQQRFHTADICSIHQPSDPQTPTLEFRAQEGLAGCTFGDRPLFPDSW